MITILSADGTTKRCGYEKKHLKKLMKKKSAEAMYF